MDAPLEDLLSRHLVDFTAPDLLDRLEAMTGAEIDALAFGAISFGEDRGVTVYNAREQALSGLSPTRILGRHMFEEVAPCMDNDLVAGRFETVANLDETLDFLLTLRMRPTPVVLRLLQREGARRWILLDRGRAATHGRAVA